MSKIILTRDTGMVGAAMKIAVYINGREVYQLDNKETVILEFEGESAEVQVGQLFMKSKIIRVKANQELRIKASAILAMLGFLATILNKPYLTIEVEA